MQHTVEAHGLKNVFATKNMRADVSQRIKERTWRGWKIQTLVKRRERGERLNLGTRRKHNLFAILCKHNILARSTQPCLPETTTMDSLKAFVAEKRKALQNDSERPKKYMRKGDLERMKEEQEAKAREEKQITEEVNKREEEAKQAAKKVGSCRSLSDMPFLTLFWRIGHTNINTTP